MKKLLLTLAVVALTFGLVGTAMAADWNFYGSARMATWWFSRGSEVTGVVQPSATKAGTSAVLGNNMGAPGPGGAGNSDLDVRWTLQPNSRVGATVSSGNVGGGFEYGTGVNVRKLYGTWNFGSGELKIGQDYTPTAWTWYSSQAVDVGGGDESLLSFGLAYAGRNPMAQLKFGGFKVALIQPNVTTAANANANNRATVQIMGSGYSTDVDVILPKLELSYRYSADKFFLDVAGGYQTYDYVNAADNSMSLSSWVVALGGGYNFGKGYVKANINYDTNGAAYGIGSTSPTVGGVSATAARWDGTGTSINDATRLGFVLVLGGQINDLVGVEFGGGYNSFSNETGAANFGDVENQTWTAYLQFPFTVADGVFIIPELGYIDYGDLEVKGGTALAATKWDAGDTFYFGAMWKINF